MKTKAVITVCVTAISILLIGFGVSFGFENKYNNGADYSRDEPFLGGHDTITSEAALLKRNVHSGNKDFSDWLLDEDEALKSFRTGAHDEDQYFPWERLEGPNGRGNFFTHFYNPDTGQGLYGKYTAATVRAKDYALTAKGMYCNVGSVEGLPVTERNKFHDYLGRTMHLLQDMAMPSHTTDDGHVVIKPFESYVEKHWTEVVNLPAFKERVTAASYLKGGYEQCEGFYPQRAMMTLAKKSHTYPNEEQLYDMLPCPPYNDICPVLNEERLRKNVEDLVPEAIMHTAGYIDCVYKALNQPFEVFCDPRAYVPPGDNPGDNPDDRFDVSDEFYWHREFGISAEQLADLYIKTALKKGKTGVWLMKILADMYEEGRSKYADAPDEVKWQFEKAFKVLGAKLSSRPSGDWDGAPDVALFAYGFHGSAIDLMLRLGEPVRFLGLDFDPAIAKDHPVMLVPSGGFSGMENSTLLKAKLDEYVKNGGTLVVLSQPQGSNWELLPVPADPATGKTSPVTGFGYLQDQSCQFGSVTIEGFHPSLSVFPSATADIGVDGYFTGYPAKTEVLLRRTANGEPAMILYPYGKGYVMAGTFYTDFAAAHSQATEQEIAFLRGIMQWAKRPAEIPIIKPGEELDLAVTVTNYADNPASNVKLFVFGSDRNVQPSEYDQPLALPAGGEVQASFRHRVPDPGSLGIHHIEYVLYDGAAGVLQPRTETDAARFAVATREKGTAPDAKILFHVTTSSQEVLHGGDCDYTFHIRNLSERSRTLRIESLFRHTARKKTWNVTVDSEGEATVFGSDPFIDPVYMFEAMEAYLYDEENRQIGQAAITFRAVAQSQLRVEVYTADTVYEPGSPVTMSVQVGGRNYATSATIGIKVVDSANATIFTWEERRDIPSAGLLIDVPVYQLPLTARAGTYSVTAQAADGEGKTIGTGATGFEVVRQTLAVFPQIPEAFTDTISVPFTVANIGKVTVTSAVLNVSLQDSQGTAAVQQSLAVPSLDSGSRIVLPLSLSIPRLLLGTHSFVYSLTYSGGSNLGKVTLPNVVTVGASLERTTWRAGEEAAMDVKIANAGHFDAQALTLAIDAPTLNHTWQQSLKVGAGNAVSFHHEIDIPTDVLPGAHEISIVLSMSPESSTKKVVRVGIPASSLALSLQSGLVVDAGGTMTLMVDNSGGAGTSFTIERLELIDPMGLALGSGNGGGTVSAGGNVEIGFTVPEDAASGTTILVAEIRDTRTDKVAHLIRPVQVRGLAPGLSAVTTKEVFLSNELVTGLVDIATDDTHAINHGSLTVAVETVVDKKSEFSEFAPRGNPVSLYVPTGITTDREGSIYVADLGTNEVKKLDGQGRLLARWGRLGAETGEFYFPIGTAAGPDGSIYVLDVGNGRVQVFDRHGTFLSQWNSCDHVAEEGYCLPMTIAVSPSSDVFLSDPWGDGILRFDKTGAFITSLPFQVGGLAFDRQGFLYATDPARGKVLKLTAEGLLVAEWGSYGSEVGQFQDHLSITVDAEGFIYVTDSGNSRIQKLDGQGNVVAVYGIQGIYKGAYQTPNGIAVSIDGNIYVTDPGYNRIQVLNSIGVPQALWSGGTVDGQFFQPCAIVSGTDGSVFVADTFFHRIQKFDDQGNFLFKWDESEGSTGPLDRPYGMAAGPAGVLYVTDPEDSRIKKFGSGGELLAVWEGWDGDTLKFREPQGIAATADGRVVVTDAGEKRIIVLDADGNVVLSWDGQESDSGRFLNPVGVAISKSDFVYVADKDSHRISKFYLNGLFVSQWGAYGTEEGAFSHPEGIAVDGEGFVYVADTGNHRIQKFDASGRHLRSWGKLGHGDGEFYYPSSVAVRDDGSLFVGDRGNDRVRWFSVSGDMSTETLFNTVIAVDQAPGTSSRVTLPVGLLNRSGRFTLKTRLANSLGQVLAKSDYPFYVSQDGFVTLLRKAKEIYRPGEPVLLEGEIRNLTKFPKAPLALSLSDRTPSGTTVLYDETVDLLPNSSQFFTYTFDSPSVGTHIVKAWISDGSTAVVEATDIFQVVEPSVEVTVEVGAEMGCAKTPIEMVVRNKGSIAATVYLTSSFDGQVRTVDVKPGEGWVEQSEVPTPASGEVVVQVAGDLTATITRAIVSGCQVQASIQAQPGYLEGPVSIPFVIANTGTEDLNLVVETRLDPSGVMQTKSYFVPKGGMASDEYSASLSAGEYRFALRSTAPLLYQEVVFAVRQEKKAVLAPPSIGLQSEGRIPVSTQVINEGAGSLEGLLVCSIFTAQGGLVWTGSRSVAVGAGPLPNQERVTFEIDVTGWTPSQYVVTMEFVDGTGEKLASASGQIIVQGMVAELTSIPAYRVVQAGEEASFAFVVRNAGMQGGLVTLSFSSLDLIDSAQSTWLQPGGEKTFLFRLKSPEDQEEREIWADYALKAGSQHLKGVCKFRCAGISLKVSGRLDKTRYTAGETAGLTVEIEGSSGATPRDLFARVNYGAYSERKAFRLEDKITLPFEVPLAAITGEKLFFGVYDVAGKALHLNSVYVYAVDDQFSIELNKQVFQPGEKVEITVKGTAGGTLLVAAPGLNETVVFSGEMYRQFALPVGMKAGTYRVEAVLTGPDGTRLSTAKPFDVEGLMVKVKNAVLNKSRVSPQDTIGLTLDIESNMSVGAVIRLWTEDPDKAATFLGERALSLEGGTRTRIGEEYPFSTTRAGTHRIVYGIYSSNIMACSGSASFDVGQATLIALTAEPGGLTGAQGAIALKASLLTLAPATFFVEVDGTLVESRDVGAQGYVSVAATIGDVKPGLHTVRGILRSEALENVKEVTVFLSSNLADLTVEASAKDPKPDKQGVVRIALTARNTGGVAAAPTEVALYEDGRPKEVYQIPSLEPGQATTVEYLYNAFGKAGEHFVRAIVDPENRVPERDEGNNSADLTLSMTDLLVFAETTKDTYKTRETVEVTTTILSLSAALLQHDFALLTSIKGPSGEEVFQRRVALSVASPERALITSAWETHGLLAEGRYTVSQSLTRDGQVTAESTLQLNLLKARDFTVFHDVERTYLKQGESGKNVVHVLPLNGWNSEVTPEVGNIPPGMVVTIDPTTHIPPGEVTLAIAATETISPGLYTLRLDWGGVDEGEIVRHSTEAIVDISGFVIEPEVIDIFVRQRELSAVTINILGFNNYSGDLSVSISPSTVKGLTMRLDKTSVTVPGSLRLSVETARFAKVGTYPLNIVATDEHSTQTAHLTLNIARNPALTWQMVATPGPGYSNPPLVSIIDDSFLRLAEFKAFDLRFGANAIMADVDGDGEDEIVVGPGPDSRASGIIKIYSKDGRLILQQQISGAKFGLVLAKGDLDGDWKEEIIAANLLNLWSAPNVRAYTFEGGRLAETGVNFAPFPWTQKTFIPIPDYGIGMSLAAGDVDGDGHTEIMVGSGLGLHDEARVRVFKIDTTGPVGQWRTGPMSADFTVDFFEGQWYSFGVNVATGDVDGDGIDEIITGAGSEPCIKPLVQVFRGDGTFTGVGFTAYPDSEPLQGDEGTWPLVLGGCLTEPGYHSGVTVATGDLDGDGVAEIVTGLGPSPLNLSWVRIFKGDGTLLHDGFLAFPEAMKYGVKVGVGRVLKETKE